MVARLPAVPAMHDFPAELVEYPQSDGEPMAETDIHALAIADLHFAISVLFAGRNDVYFAMNMFWYYQELNPKARKAPDLMIIMGVPREPPRTSFFSWREGAVPAVIFEVTSCGTWDEDWIQKRALYEALGVREYYLFDPAHDYLECPLIGFGLTDDKYLQMTPDQDGSLRSAILGVRLSVDGHYLRLTETATGRPIPHAGEAAAAVIEARAQADAALAEIQRLRAQLSSQAGNGEGKGAS